jgi:hypothetical protein
MQQFLKCITWRFMYNSTYFGRPHAHHQELICSNSLWFHHWSMVIAVLLVVVGPVDPTTTNSTAITMLQWWNQRLLLQLLSSWCNNCRLADHDQQHCYHHAPMVKPETATAVVELMMVGVRTPETCWVVYKTSSNKLEKLLHLVGWFIWIGPRDFCLLQITQTGSGAHLSSNLARTWDRTGFWSH